MRTLLATLNAKYIHANLAIRLLYDLNKHHSEGLEWKEFTIKTPANEIAGHCTSFDVVAFSCYIWNIAPTLAVCKAIKTINPLVKILLGGPEVSYEYEGVIAQDEVDYIIAGEGEVSFEQFLRSFPHVSDVPGLVYMKDGRVVANPAPPMFDLNKLLNADPYSHEDAATLKHRVLYVETSRGCPYKCGFCLASLDNKVRYLPESFLHRTLLFLMKHGRTIKFLDRTFNMKRDFALGIFRFLVENHQPGNVFQFEITADILHKDLIAYINEHVPPGLFRFEIGIQTIHKDSNLAVERKQDFMRTRQMVLALKDKIEMHLDLIVGLPFETMDKVGESVNAVLALEPRELQLGFLKFLKGTPVRATYEKHGYRFHSGPPYEIICSNYLTQQELEDLRKMEHMLEIFWNEQRAVQTLRYVIRRYDAFEFLQGLGRSFTSRFEPHQHSLEQAYEALRDFVDKEYGEDRMLSQLLILDYHLQFKLAPSLNHGGSYAEDLVKSKGVRFRRLSFSFDPVWFIRSGEIVEGAHEMTLSYNGTERPNLQEAPVT